MAKVHGESFPGKAKAVRLEWVVLDVEVIIAISLNC